MGELVRRRKELVSSKEDLNIEETEAEEEEPIIERKMSTEANSLPVIEKIQPPSSKFNPSLYRPVIVPPRPRIMEDFIANRGKVAAFNQKEENTVITLRRPQVHKSVPKVSPPVSTKKQPTGSVLDKIQAELAETKQREDELRRARKDMFRSQSDLNKILEVEKKEEEEVVQVEEETVDNESEQEEQPSSFLSPTKGKSGLISVWENRIQSEKVL